MARTAQPSPGRGWGCDLGSSDDVSFVSFDSFREGETMLVKGESSILSKLRELSAQGRLQNEVVLIRQFCILQKTQNLSKQNSASEQLHVLFLEVENYFYLLS